MSATSRGAVDQIDGAVTTVVISGLVEKGGDYLHLRYARLHHQTGLEGHLGSGKATVLNDEGWHGSGGGAHGGNSVPLGMNPRLEAQPMDLTADRESSGL